MNEFTDFWHQHCPSAAAAAGFFNYNGATPHSADPSVSSPYYGTQQPHHNHVALATPNMHRALFPPTHHSQLDAAAAAAAVSMCHNSIQAVMVDSSGDSGHLGQPAFAHPAQSGGGGGHQTQPAFSSAIAAVHPFPNSFFGPSSFGNPFQSHQQSFSTLHSSPGGGGLGANAPPVSSLLPLSAAAAAAIAASAGQGSPFKGEHPQSLQQQQQHQSGHLGLTNNRGGLQQHQQQQSHPLLRADELLLQHVSMAPTISPVTTSSNQLFDLSNQTVITSSAAAASILGTVRESSHGHHHHSRQTNRGSRHHQPHSHALGKMEEQSSMGSKNVQGHHRIDISRTATIPIESTLEADLNASNNQPSSTTTDHNNSGNNQQQQPQVTCQVCYLAASNGLHFGARTCAACAAFFRRSISDQKRYICKRSQRCVIRPGEAQGYRKMCRNCRMKRCLEIGMLPENVQNKRHRREFYFAVDNNLGGHNSEQQFAVEANGVGGSSFAAAAHRRVHNKSLASTPSLQSNTPLHKESDVHQNELLTHQHNNNGGSPLLQQLFASSLKGVDGERVDVPKLENSSPGVHHSPAQTKQQDLSMEDSALQANGNSNENTNPFGDGVGGMELEERFGNMENGSINEEQQSHAAMSLLARCCPSTLFQAAPPAIGTEHHNHNNPPGEGGEMELGGGQQQQQQQQQHPWFITQLPLSRNV